VSAEALSLPFPEPAGPSVVVHHGDCLDVLRGMADASVDAVVTDPPYGISFRSNFRKASPKFAAIANDGAPFVWWLYDAARVMRDGAPLLCFCRWDTAEAFRAAIGWAGLTVRAQVVWHKPGGGMGDLKGTPSPAHELVWVAVKGRYTLPGKRPQSVITHAKTRTDSHDHPTQKPEPLMRDLLRSYAPPGGTVLDPFAGSGTTLVAAKAEGFNAIGIEREAEYVEIIKARVGP
jgi:site-specific DNA-methyltransferase (adenine-specific)